jgi:hypothetical protein
MNVTQGKKGNDFKKAEKEKTVPLSAEDKAGKRLKTGKISGRFRRARRYFALAAILLVVIGIALFAGFIKDGTESKRFEKLQEGMTRDEVKSVLKPRLLDPIQTTIRYFTPNGKELVDLNTGPKDVFYYTENALFPEFVATIAFVDGHLIDKDLQKPTLRQTLEFWWHRVSPR